MKTVPKSIFRTLLLSILVCAECAAARGGISSGAATSEALFKSLAVGWGIFAESLFQVICIAAGGEELR